MKGVAMESEQDKVVLHTKAYQLVSQAHSGQMYGDKPYIYHLWQVEGIIARTIALPENTELALDKIQKELLSYVESAGEWFESTNSFVCLDTMVDVILHPAK